MMNYQEFIGNYCPAKIIVKKYCRRFIANTIFVKF